HPPGPARDLRCPDARRRVHQSWRAVAIQGAGADPRRRGGYRRPDRLPVLQVLNDRTVWPHVVLVPGLGNPDPGRERAVASGRRIPRPPEARRGLVRAWIPRSVEYGRLEDQREREQTRQQAP